jgi:hypothetical protein
MNTEKSLEIIQALANGIDPHTGEVYSADSSYQHPQTVRALFLAIEALERAKKSEERIQRLPGNAGKPLGDEEDQRLVTAFNSGKTCKQLAEEHGRTEASICLRLMKHGKIQ